MNIDDFRMTFIQSPNEDYVVTLNEFPGVITQVKNIKEAPKKLTEAFRTILEYSFEEKNYTIHPPREKLKIDKHYSGPESRKIWKYLNDMPEGNWSDELYDMAIKIQNLEESLIKELEKHYNK